MPRIRLAMVVLLATVSTVVYGADEAPRVRLLAPGMNADFEERGTLALEAEAEAVDARIAGVEFFDGDKLLATVKEPPFKTTWREGTLPTGNYSITARATDTRGRSAVTEPVTCTVKRRVERQFDTYEYAGNAEKNIESFRLSIPKGLAVVRGVLVVANSGGSDSRDFFRQSWYGEFLFLHDFAFIGTEHFSPHAESYPVFVDALKHFAEDSKHPELLNAPLAVTGFSLGGWFCTRLTNQDPARVIAAAPIGSGLFQENAAAFFVPTCSITGDQEVEAHLGDIVTGVLASVRPKGGLLAWMAVQGYNHREDGQQVLAVPFLDALVPLRYPAGADPRRGPVALTALKESQGWVADNASWKTGLAAITRAADFHGDLATSSWLATEDLAFIYRAYVTYDKPLKIVSPVMTRQSALVLDPGANVTIVVDEAGFPNWKKLEFYDGARKLGEIPKGAPRLTARGLATGMHVFSVLGTDAAGVTRTSNPVLVIVRKLPPPSAPQRK